MGRPFESCMRVPAGAQQPHVSVPKGSCGKFHLIVDLWEQRQRGSSVNDGIDPAWNTCQ